MKSDEPQPETSFFVHILRETDKAYHIFDPKDMGEDQAIWVPKSRTKLTGKIKEIKGYKCEELTIPDWILEKEDWI
jgi:hypothetical protein